MEELNECHYRLLNILVAAMTRFSRWLVHVISTLQSPY